MTTHDVDFWEIRKVARRKPYQVRWRTAGTEHSRTFLTKTQARHFLRDLMNAASAGEPFHIASGLPPSLEEKYGRAKVKAIQAEPEVTKWFDAVRQYVADRWADDPAKTREGIVDALSVATLVMLDPIAEALDPHAITSAMRWALVPGANLPEEHKATAEVLAEHTLPVTVLSDPDVVRNLERVIATRMDGGKAAPDTVLGRRRKVSTAFSTMVDAGVLSSNPLAAQGKRRKKVIYEEAVDPRVVASAKQVEELLTAVTYVGTWTRERGLRLVAFYALIYYSAARPSEAVRLHENDCILPDDPEAWGDVYLVGANPESQGRFTDTGKAHDEKGLKQRAEDSVRRVPIPPVLVKLLRWHIARFNVKPGGRMFRTETGRPLYKSGFAKVWRMAREFAFPPEVVAGPLARTPYDLRHAALTMWINATGDIADVADRAGNSPKVLWARYYKCIADRRERNNKRIQEALNEALEEAA